MQLLKSAMTRSELQEAAEKTFGDLVKAVVDVRRGIMAIGVASSMPTKKLFCWRMAATNMTCGVSTCTLRYTENQ